MDLVGGMAYSDLIVQGVLFQLIDQLGSNAIISQALISQRSGVPLTTVQYALRRLIKNGHVVSEFEPGVGHRYRRPDGSASSPEPPPTTASSR